MKSPNYGLSPGDPIPTHVLRTQHLGPTGNPHTHRELMNFGETGSGLASSSVLEDDSLDLLCLNTVKSTCPQEPEESMSKES